MATLARLVVQTRLDNDQYVREVRRTQTETQKLRGSFGKLKATIAAVGFGFIVKETVQLGLELGKLGASLAETQSKFDTVFGASASAVQGFVNSFGQMAGVTESEGQRITASAGAIVKGIGFTEDAAASLATKVFELTADLRSFSDVQESFAESQSRLTRAVLGETEALVGLDIKISQAEVGQKALELGLAKTTTELTRQQKAVATLALIQDRAGDAVGDLARTQDSAANAARRVEATFRQMRENIARDLLPVFESLTMFLDENRQGFINLSNSAVPALRVLGAATKVAFGEIVRFAGEAHRAILVLVDAFNRLAATEFLGQPGIKDPRTGGAFQVDLGGFGDLDKVLKAIQVGIDATQSGAVELDKAMRDLEAAMAGTASGGTATTRSLSNLLGTLTGGGPSGGGGSRGGTVGAISTLVSEVDDLNRAFIDAKRSMQQFADDRSVQTVIDALNASQGPRMFTDPVDVPATNLPNVSRPGRTLFGVDIAEVAEGLGDIAGPAGALVETFKLLGGTAGKVGDSLGSLFNSAQSFVSGFAAGGPIGGALAALPGLLNGVGDAFSALGDLLGEKASKQIVEFSEGVRAATAAMQVRATLLLLDTERLGAAAEQLGPSFAKLVGLFDALAGATQRQIDATNEAVEGLRNSGLSDGGLFDAIDTLPDPESFTRIFNTQDIQSFKQAMDDANLTFLDIANAAKAFGIPVDNLLQILITGKGDFAAATAELTLLGQASQKAAAEFAAARQKIKTPPGTGFASSGPRVPQGTPIGRLSPRARGALFKPPTAQPPSLGPTPIVAPTPTPTTQPFVQFPSVTEATADEIAAIGRTGNILLEQIVANTGRTADGVPGGALAVTVNKQLADEATIGAP